MGRTELILEGSGYSSANSMEEVRREELERLSLSSERGVMDEDEEGRARGSPTMEGGRERGHQVIEGVET